MDTSGTRILHALNERAESAIITRSRRRALRADDAFIAALRAADPQTTKLGAYSILRKENRDGVKFFLDAPKHGNGADAWVLFRASGTENMLRCYVEASTPELVEEILETGEKFVRLA